MESILDLLLEEVLFLLIGKLQLSLFFLGLLRSELTHLRKLAHFLTPLQKTLEILVVQNLQVIETSLDLRSGERMLLEHVELLRVLVLIRGLKSKLIVGSQDLEIHIIRKWKIEKKKTQRETYLDGVIRLNEAQNGSLGEEQHGVRVITATLFLIFLLNEKTT